MNEKEIRNLYENYKLPPGIIRHMQKVEKLSLKIAKLFEKKGSKIDKKTLSKAALLHDLFKFCEFRLKKEDPEIWHKTKEKYKRINHARAIKIFLSNIEEDKLAQIVATHDFHSIDKVETWEQKILFYADKRVEKDKIVSLKERFISFQERYGSTGENREKILEKQRKIFQLEAKIESQIGKIPF